MTKATDRPGSEQETDQPRSVTTAWQRSEATEQPQREAPGGRLQLGSDSKSARTARPEA